MSREDYVSLTIRRDVWEKLNKLKLELGYDSFSDLLVLLINVYERRVEEIRKRFAEVLDKLLTYLPREKAEEILGNIIIRGIEEAFMEKKRRLEEEIKRLEDEVKMLKEKLREMKEKHRKLLEELGS